MTDSAIAENKVSQALKALIGPDELSSKDQELYFEKLAKSYWTTLASSLDV